MAGKSTVFDVAGAAGVSVATVSRVMNNREAVKKTTRERVYRAMREVGYHYAPAPEEGEARSKVILVMLPNLDNPFYIELINGIYSSAGRQGYHCVLYKLKKETASLDDLKALVHDINACGLILLDPIADARTLEQLDAVAPIVQCAEFNEDSGLSFVSIDDYAASKTIVNYLVANKRRRIALINGPLRFKYARNRERGYLDALAEAGMEIDQELMVNISEMQFHSAISVATQLLNIDTPPDAIYASSDVFAVAAIKAAKRANLQVPKDLSVVGFDNTYITTMCEPSLTTMSQPKYQIGFLACEILMDRIKNPFLSHKQIMLETEFILRESG